MEPLIAEAKKILEERRVALSRLVRANVQEERSSASQLQDRSDQIAADELSEVVDRISGRELSELREIEAALERVAQGRYGTCERCGQAIGRQRLKALPETRHCMSCSARANAA